LRQGGGQEACVGRGGQSALNQVYPETGAAAGERAGMRFLEFFAANIRNPHTRRAYARRHVRGQGSARSLHRHGGGRREHLFPARVEALGVTEDRRTADPDTQATAGFKAIMREAAETRSYAATLSVLVVAKWLYLDWASRAPKPLPDNFVHAEWIMLHDNPDFRDFVGFLRAELDPIGPAQADLCRDFFRRAVALELSFFEAAYAERT
jgi:hypothetical protein